MLTLPKCPGGLGREVRLAPLVRQGSWLTTMIRDGSASCSSRGGALHLAPHDLSVAPPASREGEREREGEGEGRIACGLRCDTHAITANITLILLDKMNPYVQSLRLSKAELTAMKRDEARDAERGNETFSRNVRPTDVHCYTKITRKGGQHVGRTDSRS